MKIKPKLTLGTTVLFLLILTLGVIGTLFTNRLAKDSGQIIQDNYASLEYSREMQKALNKIQSLKRMSTSADFSTIQNEISAGITNFEMNLTLQKKNVTEAGEKEIV